MNELKMENQWICKSKVAVRSKSTPHWITSIRSTWPAM